MLGPGPRTLRSGCPGLGARRSEGGSKPPYSVGLPSASVGVFHLNVGLLILLVQSRSFLISFTLYTLSYSLSSAAEVFRNGFILNPQSGTCSGTRTS